MFCHTNPCVTFALVMFVFLALKFNNAFFLNEKIDINFWNGAVGVSFYSFSKKKCIWFWCEVIHKTGRKNNFAICLWVSWVFFLCLVYILAILTKLKTLKRFGIKKIQKKKIFFRGGGREGGGGGCGTKTEKKPDEEFWFICTKDKPSV